MREGLEGQKREKGWGGGGGEMEGGVGWGWGTRGGGDEREKGVKFVTMLVMEHGPSQKLRKCCT